MGNFYVWNFNKWKRWTIIVLFSLFAAVFLWFERDGAFTVFSKDEPTALSKGNANETNIALTFNISWGDEKIDDILKQLEQNQVHASFFVSGEWAEKHPDIVEKITEGKHELGMLGYRYKSFLDQEIEQIRKDLLHAKEVFKKLGYDDIDLLRAPSGHLNKEIIKLAEELGFKVIHWNVNPNDWKNPGTQKIVDNVMQQTANSDILLLYSYDSVNHKANTLNLFLSEL